MKHFCIGCLEEYDENLTECPYCLTPKFACICRCGFIFPDYKSYVEHLKIGCIDFGYIQLLKEKISLC
jgi:hypothetical protein